MYNKIIALQQEITTLRLEIKSLRTELSNALETNNALQKRYRTLQTAYDKIIKGSQELQKLPEGAPYFEAWLGSAGEPGNPPHIVKLLKFEVGPLSEGDTSWYGAFAFAAKLNGDPPPKPTEKACEAYYKKCVKEGLWRPPSEAELEYALTTGLITFDGPVRWLWAVDAYNETAVIDGVNPVRLQKHYAPGRIYRVHDSPCTTRYYIQPDYKTKIFGVRLVRTPRLRDIRHAAGNK